MTESFSVLIVVILALLLDKLLGEASNDFHPLVWFGRLVGLLEKWLKHGNHQKLFGVFAVVLAVIPLTVLVLLVEKVLVKGSVSWIVFSGLMLYVAIGWSSLIAHAKRVITPLTNNNLTEARQAVAMIVSRETSSLDEKGVAKAATESVLENGADAIFAPIFWFLVLGLPGVVLYRLSNTLDAMWGYKNIQYKEFGYCAARFDDVLNYIPARLTALSYALLGNSGVAFKCWASQARLCESPNAGPVMASGAGALGVSLGGDARYHGKILSRPLLGLAEDKGGAVASAAGIRKACELVSRTLLVWLLVIAMIVLVGTVLMGTTV